MAGGDPDATPVGTALAFSPQSLPAPPEGRMEDLARAALSVTRELVAGRLSANLDRLVRMAGTLPRNLNYDPCARAFSTR